MYFWSRLSIVLLQQKSSWEKKTDEKKSEEKNMIFLGHSKTSKNATFGETKITC